MNKTGEMYLSDLMALWEDGDEMGWEAQFDMLVQYDGHYLDGLMNAIQEYGMRTPILLGPDGRVWDGHHRIYAAYHLGIPTVPVEMASNE